MALTATTLFASTAFAADPLSLTPPSASPTLSLSQYDLTVDRYGPLNLLDHRSIYGKFWFPEPLLADEADVDNEIRLDWLHQEKRHHQFDHLKAEFEHAFGMVTVEIAGGYESDRIIDPSTGERDRQEGFTNIELGIRAPFFQYVSPNNFFDTTFVAGIEISPPVNGPISKDTEIVPKISNLTRIGEHFSIQTGVGVSTLIGPVERGQSTLEYSATFGYELKHNILPIPFVLDTTPLLEFDGEYTFNHDDAGHNALTGVAGARFNFKSIPGLPAQPRLGLGYVFPVDQGARQDMTWGVVTSIIFEY